MATFTLYLGDCIDVMRAMPDNSVDSIVTDPPYHLTTDKKGGTGTASLNENSPAGRARIGTGFMGMKWDGGDIAQSVEMWTEALRVLKPGGHLLAFSGSRTYHRMVCAIEDAGFEVRDQIMWLYGSGFPKSLNVSKAIDKAAGAKREVISEGKAVKRMIPGADQDAIGSWIKDNGREFVPTVTAPATDAARQWDGWGSALKPAHEPVCVARKPLAKGMTVAANVLAHGTGAINIDGCRVGTEERTYKGSGAQPSKLNNHDTGDTGIGLMDGSGKDLEFTVSGRWPANIILDGSDEVVALFPVTTSGKPSGTRNASKTGGGFSEGWGDVAVTGFGDTGSAARFFYCAKAGKKDRGEGNIHPTVKPTDLMAYLCRLVTPPGGTVLDPFMGSGSTGKAAMLEGFDFIGIDLSPDYLAIARARIEAAQNAMASAPTINAAPQPDLFGEIA